MSLVALAAVCAVATAHPHRPDFATEAYWPLICPQVRPHMSHTWRHLPARPFTELGSLTVGLRSQFSSSRLAHDAALAGAPGLRDCQASSRCQPPPVRRCILSPLRSPPPRPAPHSQHLHPRGQHVSTSDFPTQKATRRATSLERAVCRFTSRPSRGLMACAGVPAHSNVLSTPVALSPLLCALAPASVHSGAPVFSAFFQRH